MTRVYLAMNENKACLGCRRSVNDMYATLGEDFKQLRHKYKLN